MLLKVYFSIRQLPIFHTFILRKESSDFPKPKHWLTIAIEDHIPMEDTQTIRRQFADELFECVGQFVKLALKGLKPASYPLKVEVLIKDRTNNHLPGVI